MAMRKIRYIDAIFEKDEKGKHYTGGALLLQDLLRYSLVINELPLKLDVPFKKRQLYNWIVRNNKEIVDYYKKTIRRNKTSYSNRIHAKEETLDDNFEILLRLNLIKVGGIAAAEKTGSPVRLYKYTKGGILLTLITKSIDLKEVIFITVTEHEKEVAKIYHDLYQILDSAFEIKGNSSAAVIFYSTLFQNCKEKGIFDKLVERIHYIINSDSNIVNMIDLLQRALYSAFFDKQSETDLLDALYETVEELDHIDI